MSDNPLTTIAELSRKSAPSTSSLALASWGAWAGGLAKDFDEPMRVVAGWVSLAAMSLGILIFAITVVVSMFKGGSQSTS